MEFDEELDIKGKTCPMPVLLTRKKIRVLQSKQILKIVGDFEPARVNIQNFLNKEGHEVIKVEQEDDVYSIFARIV